VHAADQALSVGRAFQKEQTKMIHYCHQSKDRVTHDTIPTLENGLFALALFRTRLKEEILEGKALLEKILNFEVEGNFPVYLHEYPHLSDSFLGLRLLPVLFWVRRDFAHILGELKEKIDGAIERILSHLPKELPRWAKFRLEALEGKVGELPDTEWGLSEALISLQIAEGCGAAIGEAMAKIALLWEPDLQLYTGSSTRRYQRRNTVAPTVFGLYLSHFAKNPIKTGEPHPLFLYGALVRPIKTALTFQKRQSPFIQFTPEGECPLFIGFRGDQITHSFVLAKKHLHVEKEGELLIIRLPNELPDDEEKSYEVNFFLNHHEDHQLFVNGKKATVFQEEDRVEIRSKSLTLRLRLLEGEGIFFGHLMRGNRPSQLSCRGEAQFAAYDWRIALRTVKREEVSTIRVQIQVEQELESPQPLPSHASHCLHTQ